MNKQMILSTVSRIMLFFASLMLIPIGVGLYYGEESITVLAFVKAMVITLLVFLPLSLTKVRSTFIYIKEGFIITSVSWLLMAFFGSLPMYFSGQIPSLIDAFFEMASGLTTTGASIIPDLDKISNSVLFWRSFSHFIGGMGVLVLALAVLPEITPTSVQAMKAEVPGPQFGKILPKIKSSARTLYIIYIVLTLILIIALVLAGMPVFESINHAFATAGTGGFGMKNGSVAYYQSPTIELILSVGMLIFGVNFNIYYMILIGRAKDAFKSEELRVYLSIVALATLLISLNIYKNYNSYSTALRDGFFAVSSIITTTGFATADFNAWPAFSKWILLLLMFIGGCAGSTAGGLKVTRIIVAAKAGLNEIKKSINPTRKLSIRYDGKSLDKATERNILRYLVLYFLIFGLCVLIVSINVEDLMTSFTAVIATFNNVGPGLEIVGPVGSYAFFPNFNKIVLSLIMIMGRLELMPLLVLFYSETWRLN